MKKTLAKKPMRTTKYKKAGGRPQVTVANKAKFLKLYEDLNTNISETCKALRVSRRAYYLWMKDKRFAKTIEDIDEAQIDWAESKLRACIDKEEIKAITYYLDNMAKRRGYGKKVEHSGDISITVISAIPRPSKTKDEDEDDEE